MEPLDVEPTLSFTPTPGWLRPLTALREWWWSQDRRRRLARIAATCRCHPLDDSYVVDAMARQVEEIRNLPEVPCWG